MIEAASLSHRRTGCQTLRGLLVSLAGAWICAAQAQSDPGILRRAAELRESPAPTAASLVALPAQASVTRLAGRQGAWIQVRTAAGVTGWVHLFDVGSPGSPTTAPAQGGAPSGSSALRGLTSLLTGGGASGGTTVPTTTVGIRGLSAEDIAQAQPNAEEMDASVLFLDEALAHIRAGKANTRILDGVRVEYYGGLVPLANVATVTTPDAKTIQVQPWEKGLIPIIEKAILGSDVGITPMNNGETIRLCIPPVTEERRKQLVKIASGAVEEAKVSIRNARREAIDKLKKEVKNGLPEDVEKDGEAEVQKVHDKFIKKVEEMLAAKEKEIMTV